MPFAVDPDRPLARSLARVGRGLVAAARDSLSHLADDPVLAVHDARRDIRVSRAVLRLMTSNDVRCISLSGPQMSSSKSRST